MPLESPTVSIILPVYNGENYLRTAIESVLGQTFQDFELLVMDDGSKDSTAEIARSYGARVTYVHQENTGAAGAFNHGLRLAAGRYISWLSHDDVYRPTKLAMQVAALDKLDGPAVCYSDIQMIDSRGEVVVEHTLPEYDRAELLRHVVTGGPVCSACYSLMYDRRCIEEVGPYSTKLRCTEDVDMLSRLARRFPFIRVPEFLTQVRDHEKRAIHSKAWELEVPKFFHELIDAIPFEELFPEHGPQASKADRSDAYLWLGDRLAAQPYPIYKVAYSQYRRALRENPSDALRLVRRIAGLYRRKRAARAA